MSKRFVSAIRTALEKESEAQPEGFDIRPLLKGILVEIDEAGDPMSAMNAAIDNLSTNPQHYDAFEIEGPDDDDDDDEGGESGGGGEESDIEIIEEGEPAPPIISSKLIQIANLIDKSSKPSKSRVIEGLKAILSSVQRHPHLALECGECGKKGGSHRGWCPLDGNKKKASSGECGECGGKSDHRSWCPLGKG